jgi:hypothetical protein
MHQAMIAENELHLALQCKRISLCTQGKEPHLCISQGSEQRASLLELSDSFSKIVQHYEAKMSFYRKENAAMGETLQAAKTEMKGLNTENESLKRNLLKKKQIIDSYK